MNNSKYTSKVSSKNTDFVEENNFDTDMQEEITHEQWTIDHKAKT